MALNKENININFSQGLDTKTDSKQVQIGRFLSLQNSTFNKGGLLEKRNGHALLPTLPDPNSSYLTTFNGDLTAIGDQLDAFSTSAEQWYNRGNIIPLELDTIPLIRNNTNQSQVDTAFSPSGFTCVVFTDQNPSNLTANVFKYAITDTTNGQIVIAPTLLPGPDIFNGFPRVFALGGYFIILYIGILAGVDQLQYVAINSVNPTLVNSPVVISTNVNGIGANFDAIVFGNALYMAWNGNRSTGIQASFLNANLTKSSVFVIDSAHQGQFFSLAVDIPNQIIWVSYYFSGTANGFSVPLNQQLQPYTAVGQTITSMSVGALTSTAQNNVLTLFYQVQNSGIPFINSVTMSKLTGSVGSATTIVRGVSLASKAFVINDVMYALMLYSSTFQSTYFLINSSGQVAAKLAYQNAVSVSVLPEAIVKGNEVSLPYLIQTQIQAVNKNTNVPSGTQTVGIYSQVGINLARFIFGTAPIGSAEIGKNLNLSGGFLWSYDGSIPVENGFFLYPDGITETNTTTGGSMTAQVYFYQFTYEWTDNQGNAFISAPSIPIRVDLSGSGTSTNQVILTVPTLRLTYKLANPVKLVGYRFSTSQPVYYQFTSVIDPTLNLPNQDSIAISDVSTDATLLANGNLLYTTGGVLENIGGPAFDEVFLFDNRLWGIASEDKDQLWYSKQVIQATPVEMSDLLTLYVSPTIGAQGSTGSLRCGAVMDEKLCLFKDSAIYYINGIGPDNTGANNQYSEPTFITTVVGCKNQKSIVFQPDGLMFEFTSSIGNQIWLLGRDLSTQYVGAAVQALTRDATVLSSVNIPGKNEVRFNLSTGITIKYNYYYKIWNTDVGASALSSVIFMGLQTYVNKFGQVFQETPGKFLDGANPVLMSFTTSWIQLAGLQGYQRGYYFYLLGTYLSPHRLAVQIAYDYNPSIVQQSIINPTNYAPFYGQDLTFGSGNPYGGEGNREQWRVALTRQRCQSFQITISEIYDPSFGVAAGPGFTLSGINVVVGIKKGFRPIQARHTVGGNG
jgi:hypothetical protein